MTTRFLQFSEPSQLQGIEILFPRGIGTWQQMQQNDASFTKFIHPLTDNFRKFLCKNCNWWEMQCRWVRSRGGDPGLRRVWLEKQKAARTAQCTSFIQLLARQFCSSTERGCYFLPEYCLASFLWDPLSMRPIFNMTKYIQTSWDVCSVLFNIFIFITDFLLSGTICQQGMRVVQPEHDETSGSSLDVIWNGETLFLTLSSGGHLSISVPKDVCNITVKSYVVCNTQRLTKANWFQYSHVGSDSWLEGRPCTRPHPVRVSRPIEPGGLSRKVVRLEAKKVAAGESSCFSAEQLLLIQSQVCRRTFLNR